MVCQHQLSFLFILIWPVTLTDYGQLVKIVCIGIIWFNYCNNLFVGPPAGKIPRLQTVLRPVLGLQDRWPGCSLSSHPRHTSLAADLPAACHITSCICRHTGTCIIAVWRRTFCRASARLLTSVDGRSQLRSAEANKLHVRRAVIYGHSWPRALSASLAQLLGMKCRSTCRP